MKRQFGAIWELPYPEFGGNLPGRCRANKDGIGTGPNGLACGRRESRVVGEPPDQGVSVQEKAQSSLPPLEFVFRKRLKELGAKGEFAFHAAGLALAFFPP